MARRKRVILGLGNPGATYAGTRHNVGFEVVDRIAERCKISLNPNLRTNSITGKGRWRGYTFVVAKPQTWMNRAGESARSLQRRMNLDVKELLVVLDDIYLPVGTLRLRQGGSAGGHNGMQSVIESLGDENISRLRIGIGEDFKRGRQADHVLSGFNEEEKIIMDTTLNNARDAALMYVVDGIVSAMNQFNRRTNVRSKAVGRGDTDKLNR
ncbi:MAG: aminoacyl-tRNA hydrolase [Bacteroidetes bacterium]|nr:aminoacyl-tRNA hydrolase [Bacteroidota bacterium]